MAKVLQRRLKTHLGARLLVLLAGLLAVSSAIFLALFIWLYQEQLAQERQLATHQISLLFQAALENAMLKRDLPGLRNILKRLGRQPQVQRVMLVNPDGVVRFASHEALLQQPLARRELPYCGAACASGQWPPRTPYTRLFSAGGGTVLRTVKPIYNKKPCQACHGPMETHPINGVLVADFDASSLRGQALMVAAGLAGAGALVMALTLLAAWAFLHRQVLQPVRALSTAAARLAEGDLAARVPVRGEDELGRLAGVFNGMAERLQQVVQRLSAHDAFLQSLIDAVPEGIRVIGPDYRLRMVNAAYRRQHPGGDDPRGEPCYRAHGRKEPCPHSLVRCPLEMFRAGHEGTLRLMHAHVGRDGSELPVEIVAAPLKDATSGEMLVVEAMRDLSQQIDITQEQRLAELGQLATGIAHEIHNPLGSVRLGLQAMLRALEQGRDAKALMGYLKQVDAAVDQCIAVTDKLLRLSAPPSEKPELVDIAAVAHDVAVLLHYEAEQQGVEIVEDLQPARVLASEGDLRMLVLNLVQNAFHAMPRGGTLTLRSDEQGEEVLLQVIDTGCGMDEETRAHIFHPFFSRRADGVHGTGLGLTICRAIVERHGGVISVDSAPGQGARFSVRLPAAARRLRAAERARQRNASMETTA